MNEKVIVIINEDNSISFEVSGVKGDGCLQLTKTLANELNIEQDNRKESFYEEENALKETEGGF